MLQLDATKLLRGSVVDAATISANRFNSRWIKIVCSGFNAFIISFMVWACRMRFVKATYYLPRLFLWMILSVWRRCWLTAEPESLMRARQEITESIGAKQIIKAYSEYMGNGAVGHPDDGCAFTSSVQRLMHFLKDKKSVNKIHLFPCASNAACVFFGQAFDSHHADMLVYDFCEQSMKPILLIANSENRCVISHI